MSQHALTKTNIRWTAFAALSVVALNLWASWPVIGAYFTGDDFAYVHRFGEFALADWPSLFVRDWSGGLWGYDLPELRPFAALSFWLDIHLWGPSPLAMHVTNIVMAIACAFCVGCLAWRMTGRDLLMGVGAAAIFSLHPSHAEPLGWITGRVDLLATFCYLLGFIGALLVIEDGKKTTGFLLAWAAFFVGVFSKEFCLTLPLLLAAYIAVFRTETLHTRRRDILMLAAGFVAVFLVYWLCRHLAFGHHVRSGAASLDLFSPDYLKRQLSYLGWFFPGLLNTTRALHENVRPEPTQIAGIATGLLIVSGVLWRGIVRNRTPVLKGCLFFGVIWYAVATLPLVVASYFSPRHLFFATSGLAVAISVVIYHVTISPRLRVALFVAIGLVSGFSLREEIRPWMRAAKISQETIRVLSLEKPSATTVWIFDLPDTHAGCWTWSWAIPFSLRPPFLDNTPAATLENPSLYFAPHRWTSDGHFAPAHTATEAVLFSFTAPRTINRRAVPIATLQAALPALTSKSPGKSDQDTWAEFLARIRSHD